MTGKFPVDAPIEKVINALEHLGFQVVRRGNHSMHILQTDSGIPIKSFDPSLWNLKLFGTYEKLLPVFSYRYQKDLAEIYQKTKNIPPISFAMGYHYRQGTANLLFAARKETPPPGDFK